VKWWRYLLLTIVLVISLFPFYWLVMISFQASPEAELKLTPDTNLVVCWFDKNTYRTFDSWDEVPPDVKKVAKCEYQKVFVGNYQRAWYSVEQCFPDQRSMGKLAEYLNKTWMDRLFNGAYFALIRGINAMFGTHINPYCITWARYFYNALVLALFQTVVVVIVSLLAGYAFADLHFPGRDIVFLLLVGTMMIPGQVLLVPNYSIISRLGWLDSYMALTIPWIVNIFGIFLMRQFFLSIPKDYWDAVRVDGGNRFHYLFYVALPMAKSFIAVIALQSFLGAWNAFLWPYIMTTNNPLIRPIEVALATFMGEQSDLGPLAAASVIAIVPVVILFFFAQRQLIEGVMKGGLKG